MTTTFCFATTIPKTASLAAAVPPPDDTRPPGVKLLDVPGDPTDQILRWESDPAVDVDPGWSPRGDKLVFESDRGGSQSSDIYVMDIDGNHLRRLTNSFLLILGYFFGQSVGRRAAGDTAG